MNVFKPSTLTDSPATIQLAGALFLASIASLTTACADDEAGVTGNGGVMDHAVDAGRDAGASVRYREAAATNKPPGPDADADADADATVYVEPPTSPEEACAMAIAGAAVEPAVLMAAAFGAPFEPIRDEMIYLDDDARLLADLRDACSTGPAPIESWRNKLRSFVGWLLWAEFMPYSCEEPTPLELASIDDVAAYMELPVADVEWLSNDADMSWQRLGELLRFAQAPIGDGAGTVLYDIFHRSDNPSVESPFYGMPGVVWNYRTTDGRERFGLRQAFDNADPDGPTFVRTVEIDLQKLDGLNVLMTSPTARDSLFVGNTINVSPRYEGALYPSSSANHAWDNLTLDQEAADLHALIEALSPVLSGPWVTVGERRAAATVLRHQMSYPDDVQATVAYYPDLGTTASSDADVGQDAGVTLSPIARIEAMDSECAQRVRDTQRRILETLPELIERGETLWCLRRGDLDVLWKWATAYEWSFWAREVSTRCEGLPESPATDDELDELFFAHTYDSVYGGGDGAFDYHRNATEWGLPMRLRPEFQALAESAREQLGLAAEEAPFYTIEQIPQRPQALEELRRWVESGDGAVLAVFEADDPLDVWPFGGGGSSLTVGPFASAEQRFSTDVRDAPSELRGEIREQLAVWGLSQYIRNESFIDRE